jgi:choline dehydrogenase-like flavoprotein
MGETGEFECDYVVVGSGAGGGTLAARLAESRMRVVLLEAGSDTSQAAIDRLPDDYDVPAFHPFATENSAMRWDFHVNHYCDPARQAWDEKCGPDGVLYPRAGTLGGCTAHNAMIFVAPHDSDWNGIAKLTGDKTWQASRMRRYFRDVENCGHHPLWRALARLGVDPTGHGWNGWLNTEIAAPSSAFADDELRHFLLRAAWAAASSAPKPVQAIIRTIRGAADPNNRRLGRGPFAGVCMTPMSTHRHRRVGTRERLLNVKKGKYRDYLHIETDALGTRVLFNDANRAIGVEYLKGKRLYRAHAQPSLETGTLKTVRARREVILSGGTFNTPQLLMLSGIGPGEHLRAHGIDLRVELPGVGRNLQDRYEIGVVYRMAENWESLSGAKFERDDRLYRKWRDEKCGMYISNGAALAIVRRSAKRLPVPDLFLMALLARFEGYKRDYSRIVAEGTNYLTWAILKAHTENRAGTVVLRSPDPRDMPVVDFRYFEEGNDREGKDLRSVVEGIRFVRKIMAAVNATEMRPGPDIESGADLAQHVRKNAWGHHASGTCAIGPRDAGGVLSSNFAVHGTQGLRVVDASVFPRIPGFFIVSAVYMVAEKAADVILAAAKGR